MRTQQGDVAAASDPDPDAGLERRAERAARRKGAAAVLVAVLMLAGLLGAAVHVGRGLLPGRSAGAADFPGPGTGKATVEVKKGDTTAAIGRRLTDAGVVRSVEAFTDAAQAEPRAQGIQPGFYGLARQMRAEDALLRLLDPSAQVRRRVTLPEGLRLDETLSTLARKTGVPVADYRKAVKDGKRIGLPSYAEGNAEGFLFPATYDVGPKDTASRVLSQATRRFSDTAKSLRLSEDGDPSARDVVIVASLVEGEARRSQDFGKVARVVYNRLGRGMRLQLDSTVNYALRADKRRVLLKDLDVDSPYNTYRLGGLPPGPINSPGEKAMKAALHPPAGDWLYFVTVDDSTGETKFTSSYAEFGKLTDERDRNRGR